MVTAQEIVERSFRRFAGRRAVIDEGRTLTYGDLDHRTSRLAGLLRSWGASSERPVALFLPNCAEYIEADLAATRAGILRVGIGERLSPDEVGFILDDSGAAVLITTTELLAGLHSRDIATPTAVCVDGEYEQLLAGAPEDVDHPTCTPAHPGYLMYTSGTTGRPKGALHSQGSRIASTVNMLSCEQQLTCDSVMVHGAPLTHGSGSKVLGIVAMGGANVTLRRFRPEAFADAVEQHGGTHTFLVPTMLQRLVDATPDVQAAVRSMRQITVGGAPISPANFRRAIEVFGPILIQIYGTSEAPHPLTLLRPDDYAADMSDDLLRSAGFPAPSVSLRVIDGNGEEAGAGQDGELLVRAPSVMVGYWRRPEATSEVLDESGWYHTGDIVSISEQGAVTFRDRKRDLVITGGMNVYPTEVERVLEENPEIAMAAVVGYPDDEWGEALAAFIVRTPGAAIDEQGVVTWVRDRLAGYKKPRRVEFVESLPLGPSNKVLKGPLRERLWAGRDRRVG